MTHASFYDRCILPPVLDWTMRAPLIAEQRRLLVPQARGQVLEIGIGSGLNLPYYDASAVERLYGLDPSAELHRRARRRAKKAAVPVELLQGAAERIPMPDGSFDTVLSTYTLCSIADLPAALAEIRRVLKPGGRYLFSEHGLSPDGGVARWQNVLTPAWKHVSGGCHLNVAMAEVIAAAGFMLVELEQGYLPGPRPATYNYRGVAHPV